MRDRLTKEQRSWNMSRIRGKDTAPETRVRSVLHQMGYRFRLHRKDLPGNPDIVFVRRRIALFVHGCFWHGHGCHLFKWPQTNGIFWRDKINSNKRKDIRSEKALRAAGWRVLTIWECGLRGRTKVEPNVLLKKVTRWLRSSRPVAQL